MSAFATELAIKLRRAADARDLDELIALAHIAADGILLKDKQQRVALDIAGGFATMLSEMPLPDHPNVTRMRDLTAKVRLMAAQPEGPQQ